MKAQIARGRVNHGWVRVGFRVGVAYADDTVLYFTGFFLFTRFPYYCKWQWRQVGTFFV